MIFTSAPSLRAELTYGTTYQARGASKLREEERIPVRKNLERPLLLLPESTVDGFYETTTLGGGGGEKLVGLGHLVGPACASNGDWLSFKSSRFWFH